MTPYRPKHNTKPDANHSIPLDFLRYQCGGFTTAPKEVRGTTLAYTANYRGHKILLIDHSKSGGILTDWYMEICGHGVWIEIKTPEAYAKPDHDLTPGEQWLYENTQIDFSVIESDAWFQALVDSMIDEVEHD